MGVGVATGVRTKLSRVVAPGFTVTPKITLPYPVFAAMEP
jgi:hypothetical protein